jgi:RsiW-degrading membrane proteinase PrsW (M82 family)
MISAIALVFAAIIPLGFVYAIRTFDFYQTGSVRYLAISGAWGVAAYVIIARLNPALIDSGLIDRQMLVRFAAPALEELLKGLVLLYLVRRPDFNYFLDGAIYGFAAGIGFAIFENFEYVLGHPSIPIQLALSRVLSTNLIHATGSALIGIALGAARFDRSLLARALYLAGGLGLAIAIHSGFNSMVSAGIALLFAFAAGFAGAGIILVVMRRGLSDEKAWVHEQIGLTAGVTTGEATMVRRLNDVNAILAPLAQRFGPEKAEQIERFLFMQAQLAIQQKMLEKMQDAKMQAAIRAQMDELNVRMNAARKSVGAYCMLYLRNIFPANDIQLWEQLQRRVSSRKEEAGTGVWERLDERARAGARQGN